MAEEAEAQHEPTMEEILSSIRRIISEDGEQPAAAPEPAPAAAPKPKPALVKPVERPAPAAVAPPPPPPPPRVAPEMREEPVLELTEVVQDDGTVVSLNRQPAARRPMPEPEPMPDPEPMAQMMAEAEEFMAAPAPMPPPMAQPAPQPVMQQPRMAPPPPPPMRPPPPAADPWAGIAGLVSQDTEAATTQAFAGLQNTVSAVKGQPLGGTQRTLEELVRELLRPMLKQWLDHNLQPIVARAVEREVSRLSGRSDKD